MHELSLFVFFLTNFAVTIKQLVRIPSQTCTTSLWTPPQLWPMTAWDIRVDAVDFRRTILKLKFGENEAAVLAEFAHEVKIIARACVLDMETFWLQFSTPLLQQPHMYTVFRFDQLSHARQCRMGAEGLVDIPSRFFTSSSFHYSVDLLSWINQILMPGHFYLAFVTSWQR